MSDNIEEIKPPLEPENFPSIAPEVIGDANAAIAAEKLQKETDAKKALADKIAARVAELKLCEGKTFARNDGTGLSVKIIKYIGILPDAKGGSYYAFTVEIPGHARWNPSATDFLNEYHAIEVAAETEINSEPK